MNPVVIRPHALPRDARDAFIAVVATFLIGAALFLVGFAVVDLFRGPRTAAIVGFIIALVALGSIALRTVRGIELDDTGIRFRRMVGGPRFLSWDNVTAVRRADRAEVVLRGWLLPPIPPRAPARSVTSIGHYRFDWKGGFCYFPPAEEAALIAHLERSWGGVIG